MKHCNEENAIWSIKNEISIKKWLIILAFNNRCKTPWSLIISRLLFSRLPLSFSYFKRWPAEELPFREQKATVSLNRVAGYGKKEVENKRVKETLNKLELKKNKLENKLADE